MSTQARHRHGDIPARLDRLPWSRFHLRLVATLGACWILDGYEVAVAGTVAEHLAGPDKLRLDQFSVVALGCVYLLGQVVGALYFGQQSDQWGRRRLFLRTLGIYMLGSAATAVMLGTGTWSVGWLFVTRFVAGLGIGGEYAAINSTIDELVPARFRGRVDITVNGTYWAGAGAAALVQIPALTGDLVVTGDGWRLPLVVGPVLAVLVALWRRDLPESPRWLLAHGWTDEAERAVGRIERDVARQHGPLPPPASTPMSIGDRWEATSYRRLLKVFRRAFLGRTVLCATVMVAQAVLYNSVFFCFAPLMVRDGVAPEATAEYLLPFALCNLLGPLVLGPFFDVVGRRTMISRTYLVSGVLLGLSVVAFGDRGSPAAHVALLGVVFFFASAGASSAYLTSSELFPIQVRAKASAVFLSGAQLCGLAATLLYGLVIDADDWSTIVGSLVVGSIVMIIGGLVARRLAVDAENTPLEGLVNPADPESAVGGVWSPGGAGEEGTMPFVHGHPRDAGWVISHFRRPQRAGSEQLDLDDTGADLDPDAGSVPEPRPAPDADDGGLSGAGGPP